MGFHTSRQEEHNASESRPDQAGRHRPRAARGRRARTQRRQHQQRQAVAGGPPDTYVANWDAVGTQAFSAAALSPAEGHTIFAYVAIAVYQPAMAIKGGHQPFAVDVDAPSNSSAEAHVAAAANRVLEEPLACARTGIVEAAYTASLARLASLTVPPRRMASRSARPSCTC